ncbi:MAG: DUF411 domain-containing protein [Thermoplasmata archaeon]
MAFQNCPICGVPVKQSNLRSHARRVHPRERMEVPRREVGSRLARPRTAAPGRSNRKLLYVIAAVGLVFLSLALYDLAVTPPRSGDGAEPPLQLASVEVYLQSTCGCCHLYVDYLGRFGLDVATHEMTDLSGVRAEHGIPGHMQSCHTAVLGPYFVEGHVPVAALQRLMHDRPAIDGISLPGMPAGSPGMGGMKGAPFVIYALVGGQATVFIEL